MSAQRLLAVILACIVTGCATSYDISRDFDPGTDFSRLHTFSWMPDGNTGSGDAVVDTDTLLLGRVQNAVEQALLAKGYRKELVPGKAPDFWVTFHAALKRKVEVTTYSGYYGYGWWGYPWGYMGGGLGPQAYVRDYDERVIVLDFVNPGTRKLLWRATARNALDEDLTPQQRTEEIDHIIRQMLKAFPPLPAR